MIDSAGRMTTTARGDIGASSLSPTEKRGSEVCVQICDDVRLGRRSRLGVCFVSRLGHSAANWQEDIMARRGKRRCDQLPVLHPDAAGIDIGANELFVAVPPDRDTPPVRSFATITQDLNALADWLQHCGVRSVAMESTSVYWIPVYQILESGGFEVYLVNAHHVKNSPDGRPTCPIANGSSICIRLACFAAAAFAPAAICAIRSLWRHRASLIQMAAEHVLHSAESAGPDESADPSCSQRYYGR